MNWLASRTAAATATAGKGNEVDGSDSASSRKAPGHANTSAPSPVPDASTQGTTPHAHLNGLPAADQILALMALLNQVNPKRNPIIPPTPRVGGVDSIGAWTGHGAASVTGF